MTGLKHLEMLPIIKMVVNDLLIMELGAFCLVEAHTILSLPSKPIFVCKVFPILFLCLLGIKGVCIFEAVVLQEKGNLVLDVTKHIGRGCGQIERVTLKGYRAILPVSVHASYQVREA